AILAGFSGLSENHAASCLARLGCKLPRLARLFGTCGSAPSRRLNLKLHDFSTRLATISGFALRSFALLLILLHTVPYLQAATIPSTAGWFDIPNTKIRSVCPQNNFGGSGYSFNTYCNGLIDAWNGGVFDTTRNRFVIWGGG